MTQHHLYPRFPSPALMATLHAAVDARRVCLEGNTPHMRWIDTVADHAFRSIRTPPPAPAGASWDVIASHTAAIAEYQAQLLDHYRQRAEAFRWLNTPQTRALAAMREAGVPGRDVMEAIACLRSGLAEHPAWAAWVSAFDAHATELDRQNAANTERLRALWDAGAADRALSAAEQACGPLALTDEGLIAVPRGSAHLLTADMRTEIAAHKDTIVATLKQRAAAMAPEVVA